MSFNLNDFRKKVLRKDGIFALLYPIFFLLSKLYCATASIRNYLYDSGILKGEHFQFPVVSIGNITVGGSGKTPITETVYRIFEEAGFFPVIVCKGYRGKIKKPAFAEPDPAKFGDECSVYALKKFRTVASRVKVEGVSFAFQNGATAVVLDDGFQHRRVIPTLSIVVIDPFNPFGDNHCLPLGLLREPLSGLKRADAFVISRANLVSRERVQSLELFLKTFKKPIFRAEQTFSHWIDGNFNRTEPPENREIDLFCGIGNPGQFIEMVLKMGFKIKNLIIFDDHHIYTEEEIEKLKELKNPVTTEKDLIKLKGKIPHVKAPVLSVDVYGLKEFILANIKNVEKVEEEAVEGELSPSGVSTFKATH